MTTPLALTLKQTADALQISLPTARRMVAEDRLPVVRLGPRTIRIPVAALER
jgi:excisionase family DNA binding protein